MATNSADKTYSVALMSLRYPLSTPVPRTWVGKTVYTYSGSDVVLGLPRLHAAMDNLYDRMEPGKNRRRFQMKDAEDAALMLAAGGPAVIYAICGRFKEGEEDRNVNRLYWTERIEVVQRSDGGIPAAQAPS